MLSVVFSPTLLVFYNPHIYPYILSASDVLVFICILFISLFYFFCGVLLFNKEVPEKVDSEELDSSLEEGNLDDVSLTGEEEGFRHESRVESEDSEDYSDLTPQEFQNIFGSPSESNIDPQKLEAYKQKCLNFVTSRAREKAQTFSKDTITSAHSVDLQNSETCNKRDTLSNYDFLDFKPRFTDFNESLCGDSHSARPSRENPVRVTPSNFRGSEDSSSMLELSTPLYSH